MVVAAIGVVVLIWLVSGLLVRAFNSGEILGGTGMRGVDLGGETRDSALGPIGSIQKQKLKLTGPKRTFSIRSRQAGLVIDREASADRAYDAGRSGVGAILAGPLVLALNRDVAPVFKPVNEKRLTRTVNRIADRVDREPFVGALTIDPDTLAVSTERPKAGVAMRRKPTGEEIIEAFENGNRSIDLPTRRRSAPSAAEVKRIADEARDYLEKPLRIKTMGGRAEFTPEQIAEVLTIEATSDDPSAGIRLSADREKTSALVAGLAEDRDRPAQNARLVTPALPPVNLAEQGDLTWTPKPDAASVRKARVGRRIRQETATDETIDAVRQGSHNVRFPSERVKPEIPTDMVKGATSLLGTFTTSFSCCQPRVTNIQTIAKAVDGTVIPPGAQFSLNGIAGERTRDKGYKAAPTIGEGNKLVDSVGGGVSQFSTTAYNAAYFAGLQIDAHTPHSFYIDRYPAGRESTLNYGSIDLLWTNDTDAPVTVRSSASDTAVTVSIYGGNGDRKVRAKTVSRSNNDQGGFDITIERVVTHGNGEVSRDRFTTNYGKPGD